MKTIDLGCDPTDVSAIKKSLLHASLLLCWLKYRSVHQKLSIFVTYKTFCESKYPIHITFNFENRSTGTHTPKFSEIQSSQYIVCFVWKAYYLQAFRYECEYSEGFKNIYLGFWAIRECNRVLYFPHCSKTSILDATISVNISKCTMTRLNSWWQEVFWLQIFLATQNTSLGAWCRSTLQYNGTDQVQTEPKNGTDQASWGPGKHQLYQDLDYQCHVNIPRGREDGTCTEHSHSGMRRSKNCFILKPGSGQEEITLHNYTYFKIRMYTEKTCTKTDIVNRGWRTWRWQQRRVFQQGG